MKVSVAICVWKRFTNFDRILKAWLDEKEVDEVVIWDNSGSYKTDLPGVIVVSASTNTNSKCRFLAAQLCKNDLIVIADDDFTPHPGITKDLLKHYQEERIVGIMGKQYTGETYYESTVVMSCDIQEITRVNYLCSNLLLTHRKHCIGLDIQKIPSSIIDDMWWEHELEVDGVTCWVIPTNKWTMNQDGKYEFAHHLHPAMKILREYYFRKWIKGSNEEPPSILNDRSKLP